MSEQHPPTGSEPQASEPQVSPYGPVDAAPSAAGPAEGAPPADGETAAAPTLPIPPWTTPGEAVPYGAGYVAAGQPAPGYPAPTSAAPGSPAAVPGHAAPGYTAPGYPAPGYTAPGYAAQSSPYAPQGYAPVAPQGYAPVAPQGYAGAPVAYPGQPPVYPGYPYPKAPDTRPKGMAITALVLAIVGAVAAFIPFAAWFAWIPLLAAFILALIALVSKKHGGTGMSIASIVVSVVGFFVSIVMSLVSIGLFGGTFAGAGGAWDDSSTIDDGLGNGASVSGAKALIVTDSGFGQASDGTWWYAVEMNNPNADAVYDATDVVIEAVGADGTVLDTSDEYLTVLPGKTGFAGYFENLDDKSTVAKIQVRVPPTSDATELPSGAGAFTVADVQATSDADGPLVRGTVVSTFDQDQESVLVSAIVRDADGKIIAGEYDVIDSVPAGGRTPFTVHFYDDLPPGVTVDVYPSL